VAEDVPQDVTQDLAFNFGARAARALLATPPPPPTLRSAQLALSAEMGAQLGSSVAFGSGCGQALEKHVRGPGVGEFCAKRLYVNTAPRELRVRFALCSVR